MALDDVSLAEIGRLYREGELTLAEIGRRFGCTDSAISKLARTRGWPMRRAMTVRAAGRIALVPAARVRLVRTLCAAITTKLEQMEKGMTSGELSAADCERDAKAVGSMLGGLEKVTATVPDADEERPPKSAGAGANAGGGEAERLHREIIERFERIQRRRDAERGSQ
jgi:hypothetical protein